MARYQLCIIIIIIIIIIWVTADTLGAEMVGGA